MLLPPGGGYRCVVRAPARDPTRHMRVRVRVRVRDLESR
jgi:hypothetical protein